MNIIKLNTIGETTKKGTSGGEGGLQIKSVDISENGSKAITPDAEYSGMSKVIVNTDVNTLGGLDFEGVFDQEQADELNQYYLDGIEYAKQIKAENPNPSGSWVNKFKQDERLLYMPKLDLQDVTSLQTAWSGCQNLIKIDYIDAPNTPNMNNMLSFCPSLLGVVKINSLAMTSMSQCFYNNINITEIHLSSIAKCSNFTQAFYASLASNIAQTRIVHLKEWRQGDISFQNYSLLESESIHYIIQNAVDIDDGATARTLYLHATAKTNWENSEYYEEDEITRITKGIEIA